MKKDGLFVKLIRKALLVFLNVPILTKILNRTYNNLNIERKSEFHRLFYAIFRGKMSVKYPFTWEVKLPKGHIKYFIDKANINLRWEAAISVLGHDSEIKETYQYLIDTGSKCVFDVGSNYGTHSFFFKSQGVRVISFEPNPGCVMEMKSVSKENRWSMEIQEVGVGNADTKEIFTFPEGKTWCGSFIRDFSNATDANADIHELEVGIVTLDHFTYANNVFPDVIKIDTEGFEMRVLEGSKKLISEKKPKILFEANSSLEKMNLYEFFRQFDYEIYTLPFNDNQQVRLGHDEIKSYPGNNFLALVNEKN